MKPWNVSTAAENNYLAVLESQLDRLFLEIKVRIAAAKQRQSRVDQTPRNLGGHLAQRHRGYRTGSSYQFSCADNGQPRASTRRA